MMTTRLRPAAGSFAMDVFSNRPVFATTVLPGLCRLRSRAGIWPELPLPSWTSVLRTGCLCPGLGLSCVTSVRGDERSWLALGARVTINRICSHSARLGEIAPDQMAAVRYKRRRRKLDRVGSKYPILIRMPIALARLCPPCGNFPQVINGNFLAPLDGWAICSCQAFLMASTTFCSNPSGRTEHA